jgi:hypothetical protein
VALVLPWRLVDRLKRVKRGDRSKLIAELLDQYFRTIDGQSDTGERYSNVYWTVDDLLDPGCNGLAVNWDEMTAHACLAALQDDVAQAMCEAGWEHLEIWVPLWARRNNAPVPIPYDSEDAEDYANTDNYAGPRGRRRAAVSKAGGGGQRSENVPT